MDLEASHGRDPATRVAMVAAPGRHESGQQAGVGSAADQDAQPGSDKWLPKWLPGSLGHWWLETKSLLNQWGRGGSNSRRAD
jgi:hypothetical protein